MNKNFNCNATAAVGICLFGVWAVINAIPSYAAGKSDVIASDPCKLVTLADLRSVLAVTFPSPNVASDVDTRTCQYESDKLLVSVYTGNEELSDFQKDQAEKRNDSWGKTIKVSNVAAPYYQNIGEGRLIVWKNKTRLTIGVQDVSLTMSDEALEAAREKLVNIALSRIT